MREWKKAANKRESAQESAKKRGRQTHKVGASRAHAIFTGTDGRKG